MSFTGSAPVVRIISLEFRRGRARRMVSKMRFRNALGSRPFQCCSRENHTYVRKLLDRVSERSKLLKKVSVLVGYSNPQDLVEKQRAPGESSAELISALKEIDFPEITAKFPCIKVGDASPVELYEDSTNMKFKEAALSEKLTNFIQGSARNLESAYEFHNDCHPLNQTPTTAGDLSISEEIPLIEPIVDTKSPESLSDAITSDNSILDKSIRCLPGTTSRQYRQLEDGGFHTVRKLLQHFPRTYADLQNPQGPIEYGQYIMLSGTVISSRGIKVKSTLGLLEVVVGCSIIESELSSSVESSHSGAEQKRIHLHLNRFFSGARFSSQHFLNLMSAKHKEGDLVYVSGKIKKVLANGHYELKEYTIDAIEGEGEHSTMLARKPHPIYPSKAGLKPSLLGLSISRALKILSPDVDPVPPDVLVEFNLPNLFDVSRRLFQMLEAVGTRVEKEELLYKCKSHELNTVGVDDWSPLTKKLLRALPYWLTPSQLDAVQEIIWDLRRPVPMNRLLQGDVGCGKTIVAFLACMEVVNSGFQGLKTGEIGMVIGTHCLIADKTEFSALRISVIDEQQRFGVVQRGRFNSKLYTSSSKLSGENTSSDEASDSETFMAPHVLAMSATPIPRTLALALYGDMSLTQITDLPPGRQPIKTLALEGNDVGFEAVFQMMRDELIDGGKVYLVYPIIDESEHLPQLRAATAGFDSIKQKFEGYPCGLLHGRMRSDEKEETLNSFRSGETRILLSTQVIEIGVDVPDASMMVVMNAERFGISQLHQLRGRVGRGERKSRCIFLASTSSTLPRLKVLEKSSDGFYLANADLLLRGPGNLLGKKQSGHLPEFPIARLEVDGGILQEAHLAALKVLVASNDLALYPRLKVELSMRQPLCILGD
ncbi:ATP-dependent DNA helicase homolog RECG chloroplastic [Zea mays]|uniref:ATP-dependent DNA helicase homolog RECG chloroplastic n=1 Tax=Zea mays TaxID=4577 RepID=A0A1D6HHW4_MAIZE|nr:ATP-dependent DNA helicase homolog RECG chloroplastic [Zea mays]